MLLTPISFHITNFKSIKDSGVCTFSKDNITVLAGQNESGKTAILTALRDFDLDVGDPPLTDDYQPDGDLEAIPKVTVSFSVDADSLKQLLTEEKLAIPETAFQYIKRTKRINVTRNLIQANYELDPELVALWTSEDAGEGQKATQDSKSNQLRILPPDEFCQDLRQEWPAFVYFDTFQDRLPRTVDFSDLLPESTSMTAPKSTAPQSVLDFITLSEIDLDLIKKLELDSKKLGNYLRQRNAKITGDFLDYWNQRVSGQQVVRLSVEDRRDNTGKLQLAFYVTDGTVNQYPEQRSRGFLWFLSFYLRLAAAQERRKKNQEIPRVLLVDEPGTYLHARAQRDVLKIFNQRLSKRDYIVYSTHSNFLIPTETLHRLRVVLKTADGTVVLDKLTDPLLRGPEAADTLSPILTALGMDIRDVLTVAREKNLIVEGISDHSYLSAWIRVLNLEEMKEFNIFPAMGAFDVPHIASLFIGWGLDFVALLDREPSGDAVKKKLENELGVLSKRIVQPKDAAGIEDLLSSEDFRILVKNIDPTLTIESNDSPTRIIKKLKLNKILLARRYAELVFSDQLKMSSSTRRRVEALLTEIRSVK